MLNRAGQLENVTFEQVVVQVQKGSDTVRHDEDQ